MTLKFCDLIGSTKKNRMKIAKFLNEVNFEKLCLDIIFEEMVYDVPFDKTPAYKEFVKKHCKKKVKE